MLRIIAIQYPEPVVERPFVGQSQRHRRRFDAGYTADSLQAPGIQPVDGGAGLVAGVLQRDLGGDDVSRVEAGIEPIQIAEGS